MVGGSESQKENADAIALEICCAFQCGAAVVDATSPSVMGGVVEEANGAFVCNALSSSSSLPSVGLACGEGTLGGSRRRQTMTIVEDGEEGGGGVLSDRWPVVAPSLAAPGIVW